MENQVSKALMPEAGPQHGCHSGPRELHHAPFAFKPPSDPSLRGAVDVVIPVRNGARTILTTLASVVGQTTLPRRIIVVDDGSTDDTANTVASISNKLVQLIKTPAIGVSHARNTGIEASRAEFIAFLDADDRWHPDKLRRQLQVFAGNPEVAVVYCGYALLRPSGTTVETQGPTLRGFVFNRLLAGRFGGNSSCIVVRREALLHVGGYDESVSYSEDGDLHLRLSHHYKFDFARDILAYVIENPDSVTRRPASMEGQQEALLQNISIYEKWFSSNKVPHQTVQNFRKCITYTAVRRRYGWRWMLELRAKLQRRSPMSARNIWPSHATYAGWIALATLQYTIRGSARAMRLATAAMSHRGGVLRGDVRTQTRTGNGDFMRAHMR